jgi:hypothetical protein
MFVVPPGSGVRGRSAASCLRFTIQLNAVSVMHGPVQDAVATAQGTDLGLFISLMPKVCSAGIRRPGFANTRHALGCIHKDEFTVMSNSERLCQTQVRVLKCLSRMKYRLGSKGVYKRPPRHFSIVIDSSMFATHRR